MLKSIGIFLLGCILVFVGIPTLGWLALKIPDKDKQPRDSDFFTLYSLYLFIGALLIIAIALVIIVIVLLAEVIRKTCFKPEDTQELTPMLA